ncbi:transmembrane protein 82 [Arapaima gigas]
MVFLPRLCKYFSLKSREKEQPFSVRREENRKGRRAPAMMSLFWWLPWTPGWMTMETPLLDSLLQGLVGACGVSVLCNLLRVHLFLEASSSSSEHEGKNNRIQQLCSGAKGRLSGTLQFWFIGGILLLVGSRVASLVVLEFILRAAMAQVTAEADIQSRRTLQFLSQCQFSLGCAFTCSLHFLQEGAPQRSFSLLLAVGLSWFLANLSTRMWHHVVALYPLHSSQRYCGLCIGLLASGHSLLPLLSRAVVMTFAVGAVAGLSTVNSYFLSATEALKFWTPLTICYTLLVVYMQDEQQRRPGADALLRAVGIRLGGLLVLMLTVGRWVDVFHILLCFLGEAGCLLPSWDLLDAVLQDMDTAHQPSRRRVEMTRHTEVTPKPKTKTS